VREFTVSEVPAQRPRLLRVVLYVCCMHDLLWLPVKYRIFLVMDDEVKDSLTLTQEQLDELALVFKSVKRFIMSLFAN